jgi:hypothetical protein
MANLTFLQNFLAPVYHLAERVLNHKDLLKDRKEIK